MLVESLAVIAIVVVVGFLVAFAAALTWTAIILLAGVCIGVGIGAVVSYVLWQKHKDRDRKERREDLLEFMALVRLGQESRHTSIEDVTFIPPSRARLPARQ
jgi:hypothetical protein